MHVKVFFQWVIMTIVMPACVALAAWFFEHRAEFLGPPPWGWKPPVEMDQDMSHSGWRQFEDAFARHDVTEVNKWIGAYVSFTAEPSFPDKESMVWARRIDADDPEVAKFQEQALAAATMHDLKKFHAVGEAWSAYDRKLPLILCRLEPHSAQAIFNSPRRRLTTFDMQGIIRKVDSASNCIWVDPVFFQWSKISL